METDCFSRVKELNQVIQIINHADFQTQEFQVVHYHTGEHKFLKLIETIFFIHIS